MQQRFESNRTGENPGRGMLFTGAGAEHKVRALFSGIGLDDLLRELSRENEIFSVNFAPIAMMDL